jgi:MoaA/NifB/PqqE/SkfB family radical SAM enzyme
MTSKRNWNYEGATAMNRFIKLNRIEFVITDACSGRCKHCSNGERSSNGESVNADAAVTAIKQLADRFEIKSVMTFGGEPLLFAKTVCEIHAIARDCGIPKRQLITNGFFSKDQQKIDEVAKALCVSGVNDVLLSVDVFHQEFIPIEPVMQFAEALLRHNVPSLRVQPAWVVNEADGNPYNTETRRLLKPFTDKGIRANEGNNVFPSGNALKHLADYFAPPEKVDLTVPCGSAPYTSRLDEISCFGINPNGDVNLCSITIGNIYTDDILKIVDNYDPYNNPLWRTVLDGGVTDLLKYAEAQGVKVDISDCRSACGVCRKVMAAMKARQK